MLPVDSLKIDGQFIRGLIEHSLDAAAVRCFIDVARVVGIQTVAEYVDRPDVLARLREMGADGIVGIDFDYEVLGETNGMMMVAVSGTAVKMG